MDLGERIKLIVDYREALEKAKADYERAKREFGQVKHSGAPLADGTYAIDKAAEREYEALLAFRSALWRFNRLILDGQPPEAATGYKAGGKPQL